MKSRDVQFWMLSKNRNCYNFLTIAKYADDGESWFTLSMRCESRSFTFDAEYAKDLKSLIRGENVSLWKAN